MKRKSGSKEGKGGDSPCQCIEARIPPGGTVRSKDTRYLDIHEGGDLDEARMATWVKQGAALPAWEGAETVNFGSLHVALDASRRHNGMALHTVRQSAEPVASEIQQVGAAQPTKLPSNTDYPVRVESRRQTAPK